MAGKSVQLTGIRELPGESHHWQGLSSQSGMYVYGRFGWCNGNSSPVAEVEKPRSRAGAGTGTSVRSRLPAMGRGGTA